MEFSHCYNAYFHWCAAAHQWKVQGFQLCSVRIIIAYHNSTGPVHRGGEQEDGMEQEITRRLLAFLDASPRCYHAAEQIARRRGGAGVGPGNHQSAGKRYHGKTRKGNKTLKSMLVQCAKAASRVKGSYFAAQYQRIAARRGKNRATMAVAHSMLIAIYHVLKEGVPFRDLGADYYDGFRREHKIRNYLKRLQALGWEPELPSTPAGHT